MNQDFNNSQNEFLWTLLANPANDAHLYAYNLQRLVNDFPQSGILQAFLAHASDEKNLRQASVYFNAKSLYKLINAPSTFIGVPDEKIIIQTTNRTGGHYKRDVYQHAEENLAPSQDESIENIVNESGVNNHSEIEAEPEIVNGSGDYEPAIELEADSPLNNLVTDKHHITEAIPEIAESTAVEEQVENNNTEIHEAVSADTISTLEEPELIQSDAAENEGPEEPGEDRDAEIPEAVSAGTISTPEEPELIHNGVADNEERAEHADEPPVAEAEVVIEEADAMEPGEQEPEKGISDETFDEILGIEYINIEPETNQTAAVCEKIKVADQKPEHVATINDEAEKLIPDNIASTDFFMFNRAFGEHKQVEQAGDKPPVSSVNTADTNGVKNSLPDDADHQDVSKYHDEQMPYTFMWWLDKTRKEHAGAYQPYVKSEAVNFNNRPKMAADELQQQYFENIFHITSIDELDKGGAPPAVPFNIKRKEHVIIERFIKEEPQIKPQSSDKLDNENKAKKSSEDRDELVTETLAGIYSDQMLYHKAIASYKKLLLKFPEKSRYFADKIEQLEKKTN